jgi:hypothetical protein
MGFACEITEDRTGNECSHNENPDNAHDRQYLYDDRGGISIDVTYCTANLNRVGGDCTESHEHEEECYAVKERLLELVFYFEERDRFQHLEPLTI